MGRLPGAVLNPIFRVGRVLLVPPFAAFLGFVMDLEAASGDPRRVKTAFFGEVETDGVALAVMDGGTHGVQGHTIVVGVDGTATWERRLDGLRPKGGAGRGGLELADDERKRIEAWSRAAWDTAGPSGRASFFVDPSQGPPRWVWALVVCRGGEARLVEGGALVRLGGSLPAPLRPLLDWLVDRVDELSQEAVGNETTSADQPADERESTNRRFQLHILDESSIPLRLGYDFEPAWTLLKRPIPRGSPSPSPRGSSRPTSGRDRS